MLDVSHKSDALHAKVFISCGQASDEERAVARQVADGLVQNGYEPYVAVEEQTLEGLTNNILRQLETSEYFLFIDFRRESLCDRNGVVSDDRRGSLFCHQELAVASYLGLEVIGFREKGVRKFDGMTQALQLNAREFADRQSLPSRVLDEVKSRWDPTWKNKLVVRTPCPPYGDAKDQSGVVSRYYVLDVVNLHSRRSARLCQVYPTRLRPRGVDRDLLARTTELKWGGYQYPDATVRAGASRPFNALIVPHRSPIRAFLPSLTDASDFVTWLDGPGEFDIEYEIVSLNFPRTRCQCLISLAGDLEATQITIVGQE